MVGKIKALAAGFVLGLLIAPRSGRESRRLIREWIEQFFETRSSALDELEEELADTRDSLP